jgi:protein KRI1
MLREKKEAEERQMAEEKARLRKLKVEEAEERIKRIKEAAGIQGKVINVEEWADLLGGDWDDDRWEEEMQKRFGEDYYAEREEVDEHTETAKKNKVKKPKWDDDIDIKDILPGFEEEEAALPPFRLSDDEDDDDKVIEENDMDLDDDGDLATQKPKSKKDRLEERKLQKKTARLERRQIEEFVEDRLKPDILLRSSSKTPSRFRYRDTSPTAYGLTPQDILLASDQQLNEYAGLKKLATFRDAEKKRKDKRRLGKKARLRQWRKDTFGDENGPRVTYNQDDGLAVIGGHTSGANGSVNAQGEKTTKKKRKRSGKGKGKGTPVET